MAKVEEVYLYPPETYLLCMDKPHVPDLKDSEDGKIIGTFILRMDVVYNDCKAALERVKRWVDERRSE